MSNELIQITQLPIIEERLREVKAEWEQIAADNMSLVCTAETIQSVKMARADMTKKFEELEELRKAIKASYMESYNAFDATYKECITAPYKIADTELKRKIDETESEIKDACEQRCREYFAEMCALHGVDFVKFEHIGLKIDMTSAKQKTPRKLLDQINEWISAVSSDMGKIDRESDPDDRDEIMSEYKCCLNVGEAILRVQDRKNRLAAEKQAASEREALKDAEAQAIAKVEAAAVSVTAPPVEVKRDYPQKISFTIYPKSAEEYAKIRPCLMTLREILTSEDIRYE